MRRRDLNRKLEGANPVKLDRVESTQLREAEEEMLAAILDEEPLPRQSVPSPARSRRTAWSIAVATGLIAAVTSIVWLGGGLTGQSSTAYGSELIRFAKNSPLILLAEWQVGDVIEHTAQEGEMRFFLPTGGTAQLSWRAGSFQRWASARARDAAGETTAHVLDSTARVFRYPCCRPGRLDFTALWRENGRVLEFRSIAPTPAAFRERLADLESVDVETWLAALPRRVVQAVDRPVTVEAMLRGIPLPPGFEAEEVKGGGLMTDRSTVALQILGTVACAWRARWLQARGEGDRAGARAAVEALGSLREWPIVRDGSSPRVMTEVVEEAAKAMPSGRWMLQCRTYR